MFHDQFEWVVLGITEDGKIFDVPDWPGRVCEMVATQWKNPHARYSKYLHPARINGFQALVMQSHLEQIDPAAYATVRQFARENGLKVRSGPGELTGNFPAYQNAGRQYVRG